VGDAAKARSLTHHPPHHQILVKAPAVPLPKISVHKPAFPQLGQAPVGPDGLPTQPSVRPDPFSRPSSKPVPVQEDRDALPVLGPDDPIRSDADSDEDGFDMIGFLAQSSAAIAEDARKFAVTMESSSMPLPPPSPLQPPAVLVNLTPAEQVMMDSIAGTRPHVRGPQKYMGIDFHADLLEHVQWVESPAAGGPMVILDFAYLSDIADMIHARLRMFGMLPEQGRENVKERDKQDRAKQVALIAGHGKIQLVKLSFEPESLRSIDFTPSRSSGSPIGGPDAVARLVIRLAYRHPDAFDLFATVWHPDMVVSVLD
jgi:hypothetical protein